MLLWLRRFSSLPLARIPQIDRSKCCLVWDVIRRLSIKFRNWIRSSPPHWLFPDRQIAISLSPGRFFEGVPRQSWSVNSFYNVISTKSTFNVERIEHGWLLRSFLSSKLCCGISFSMSFMFHTLLDSSGILNAVLSLTSLHLHLLYFRTKLVQWRFYCSILFYY